MGERQCLGDGLGDLGSSFREDAPAFAQHLGEGLALDVLHDDEMRPVVRARVEHADHVGMVERRGGLGLAAESDDEGSVPGELRAQDLDRDGPAEDLVPPQVDLGHPSLPQH